MTEVCPACGQEILLRHGVTLQRKKVAILDLIEKHTPHGGIALDLLADRIYPDEPRPRARERIKTQICQLNDVFEATDWRVVNRNGSYRFIKAKMETL